jgi:hypothetical protein
LELSFRTFAAGFFFIAKFSHLDIFFGKFLQFFFLKTSKNVTRFASGPDEMVDTQEILSEFGL